MDLEALRHGNFASLGEAIGDWSRVVKNLTTLKNDARDDLKGKADKADWAGLNATVSREFITKTAGEFADAVTQATTIRDILRDTRDELVGYRGELTRALDRGWEKHLNAVGTQGGGFKVFVNVHPEPANSKQAVDALRDELQGILTKATTSDTTAAQVLRALSKQAEHGFSDASYKDRDSAADALRNADDMAGIAKKDPKDLTAEDFDKLNSGMKKYRDDPLFSEQFATRMGAKGTLEFWAGINSPHENPELTHSRHDKFGELQKSLGLTLANATQSDSPEMQRWEKNMVGLGSEYVPKDTGRAMGFQVMSNLMRWGDYDDKFLKDYGTGLIKTEKDRSENGRRSAAESWNTVAGPLLNRTGTDSGNDPMTGFMKALANSPDASTDFFNDSFVTKNEDHDFLEDTDDKNTYEGKRSLSNFDYLFEERDWPKDVDEKGKESVTGRDFMAQALESATTGHPAGEQPAKGLAPHNAEQADLMENIVASIFEDGERLTKHGHMSDSFGQIAAEYLPDINRATADDKHGNTNKLFPIAGAAADLSHASVTRFLFLVGQDPDGYANVETGQKSYMANLMDYHLNPDTPTDQRYPHPTQDTITAISHRSGEIAGTLGGGRQEAVLGPAKEADSDFDDAVAQKKNTWSGAIGTGVGVGVSFIASPVGGAVAGGVAGTVSSVVLEHLFQQSEAENLNNADQNAASRWEDSKDKNGTLSQEAAKAAVKAHNSPNASGAADWALTGTAAGFTEASASLNQMAKPEPK